MSETKITFTGDNKTTWLNKIINDLPLKLNRGVANVNREEHSITIYEEIQFTNCVFSKKED